MRRISIFLINLIVCCGLLIPSVFADNMSTTDVNIITIEEYETALKAEGKKYGIMCEVLNYNPSMQITTTMLKNALNDLRSSAKSFQVTSSNISPVYNPNRVVPIRDTFSNNFQVSCPPYGYAYIKVEIDATVDQQNSSVITVHSANAYQSGAFVNFDSWETKNISIMTNNPNVGMVTAKVKGNARFSYADPVTGVTTGMTYPVEQSVIIQCW